MTAVQRSYEVRTFGCQMNVHDSERISGLLFRVVSSSESL
jgi:tRNA-2-methylthio-N6-dimethylallyladenosine synthase